MTWAQGKPPRVSLGADQLQRWIGSCNEAGKHEHVILVQDGFIDERGQILNILSGIDVNHIAVISSKAGTIRGNHWHPRLGQLMYLIAGSYVSFSRPMGGSPADIKEEVVSPGEMTYCPPNVTHGYFFTADSVFLNIGWDGRESGRYEEHTRPDVVMQKLEKGEGKGEGV